MKLTSISLIAAVVVCTSASSAFAQGGRPDPFNQFQQPSVSLHPEFRAAAPPTPRNMRQAPPVNPGTSNVPSRIADKVAEPVTDPLEKKITRHIPIFGPLLKLKDGLDPSPGDVFCAFQEPCSAFVDGMWPNQISKASEISSAATNRARSERTQIRKALEDPSAFPSYNGQCWDRAALEAKLCDTDRRVRELDAADQAYANRFHDAAREVETTLAKLQQISNDPNLSADDRRAVNELTDLFRSSQQDFQKRGITPSPTVLPRAIAPPTRTPTVPEKPKVLPQTTAPARNCPGPGSCGVR